jgi:hypothetical protein
MAASDLPAPLVCSICEFSLTSFVTASSRERGKRGRRSYSADTSSRAQGPPIDLVENASVLYLHLSDAIIASMDAVIDAAETPTLEAVLDDLPRRQYFDPTVQAYVSPTSLTLHHLEFIVTNEPTIRARYELDGQLIRRR